MKRQVSHQTWTSGLLHTSKKEYRGEIHSAFETHEETHEVQNRSNQWLHKMGLGPTKKNLFKIKNKNMSKTRRRKQKEEHDEKHQFRIF